MSLEFDIGPLSWVKDEIDRALDDALAKTADFAAAPADPSPLRFCQTYVHQVAGALSMVGLEGVQRFAEEAERLAATLEKGQASAAVENAEILSAALRALRTYIQALADGAPDIPLRLFPEFKAMQVAQGVEQVQESELFFPDLFNSAPAGLEHFVPEGMELPVYLNEQGQKYRKLLVQWLKAPDDQSLLSGMRDALEAVERAQALPSQKTLWWVAVGLIDAIAHGAVQLDKNCRQLLLQLERQIHYLAQGNAKPNNRLLRDVLYYAAIAAPVTERLRRIQQVFELEKYRQSDAEMLAAQPATALQDADLESARSGIAALKECWMQVSAGQADQRGTFLEQSHMLADKAEAGESELKRALEDIAASAQVVAGADTALDPMFSIEMATTLLMLESALAASGKARSSALEGAAAQAAAMRAMLPGSESSPEDAPVAHPAATQDETLAVLAQVADEIRANLQRVEQTLDDFFRDAGARDQLAALTPLFKQVAGAFRMLEQPVAAEVIDGTHAMVDRFAQQTAQVTVEEFELVAESLSALGFYLDRLLQGDSEASHAIDPLPQRLQFALSAATAAPPAIAEVQAIAPPEPDILVDRALDEELLEVYLAEAGEVHETIVSCMQKLRAQPDDHEALVTIRRAFHTLKGSGRTVGLTAMGEVAWAVEQLLNHLIEQRSGLSAPVLDFIDSVSEQFQDWVRQLFTHGEVTLAPSVWKARADALLKPAAPVEEVAATPVVEPAPVAKPETVEPPAVETAASTEEKRPAADLVVIGGKHSVNRELFDIFMGEARANLGLLQELLAAAQAHAESAIPDIERPAHTLGGVSRTVGLTAISDLGGALEFWLEQIKPRFAGLSQEELHLFDQSAATLQSMLQKVENYRLPAAAPWLCDALRALPAPAEEVQAPAEITLSESTLVEEGAAPAEPGPLTSDSVLDAVPSFVSNKDSGNIDRQLLEVFLEESNELMPLVGRQLRDWQGNPADTAPQQALQRALHTLKGSARMAGAMRMGDDLHDLETQVEKALAKGAPTARSFTVFFKQYDAISEQLDELRHHAEAPAEVSLATAAADAEALATADSLTVTPMMRVRSDAIDHLVNEAGEVSIARSRIERQMETFKSALLELTDSVIRLRTQLREAEIEAETQMQSRLTQLQEAHETFDPLEFDRYTRFQELTRMMAESVHDVATVQQGLMVNLNETEAALNEQSRMTKQLQQGLMRTRMVRFDTVSERLHRIVRQTSAELKRPAELEIQGEAVDIDRSVLEKMVGPLEHLLRNAIAHGLEDAKKRAQAKKPKVGHIGIQARQEGNEIILSLSDDGSGLDFDKIKAKAASLGLLNNAQLENPAELVSVIFEPGFSTSDNVTQVSGRGVGLDAVRAGIAVLGGRVEVASEAGQGSTFTIYLPLTLAVNQTVLVRVGEEEFLLPAPMVEQVQKIKQSALPSIEAAGQFTWAGRQYPLHHLSRLLGRSTQPEPQAYTPIMLLRSGTRRIALIVDEIRGNREIVVKNIGPQLAGMGSISGATVMGDGKVMLILNPIHMAFREALATEVAPSVAITEAPSLPTVLVVDDSLTMRKVISRLLAREGYHAVTAKDGVDALQQLESIEPEVILLDIEMPRMDGFELARAVRGNAKTARIPMIVISSRTADKHRTYAQEIGVNVYLGKPYQEEELLTHIAAFVDGKR